MGGLGLLIIFPYHFKLRGEFAHSPRLQTKMKTMRPLLINKNDGLLLYGAAVALVAVSVFFAVSTQPLY